MTNNKRMKKAPTSFKPLKKLPSGFDDKTTPKVGVGDSEQ